ncbi:hypothetical protein OHA18_18900 [Kribbella sp. NBC_00709]|uniref:hypothetical protein n=1 Tax=Kribbella sp. NBC_00709 TaxID=2975972 RepID=UPI002E28EAC6|nr:hypothetical protein [Kribbella sp. NBC_00709]
MSRRSASFLAGLLALVAAVVAYWIRWHERQQWQETVVAGKCQHVPPLPHVGAVTVAGLVLCLAAVGCFIACLPRSHPLIQALACVLLVAALLGAAGGTLVLVDTPTKTSDGLDGSGLPCPSG